VKKKTPRNVQSIRLMGVWIVLTCFFITELLVYTWCRVQCIRIGYEISAEANKQAELIAVKKKLRIELERLKSPERIARIAKERLNLALPTSEQIITIR
jgi:cell division protein FtsL